MGEQSYFKRKFYSNKFKRSKKPRSPIATGKLSSNGSHQPETGSFNGRCEQTTTMALETDLDQGPSLAEVKAVSGGDELAKEEHEIRQEVNLDQDCDQGPQLGASSSCSSEKPELKETSAEFVGAMETRGPETSDEQVGCDQLVSQMGVSAQNEPSQHIETLNFHPDAESFETSDISEQYTGQRATKESRLLKATRAILMFRRATSSLSTVTDSHSTPSALKSSRSFVSSFWRQNTAPDATTCTRSSRMDSFASFGTHQIGSRSHSSLTSAFLQVTAGNTTAPSGCDPATGVKTTTSSSSSFSLPRFIVPKMNALKLPIVCLIRSLDDELMREIFIHRYELGQYLIDNLKVSLGMRDEKYFGLKMANSLDEQEDVRRPWLDLNESVYKQLSKHNGRLVATTQNGGTGQTSTRSVSFYLRIKFYPPNLARVQDQFLRHYLWLQLRRDLRLGKLTSSMDNLTYLMACILQYELGDFNNELVESKLPNMSVLPNQDLIEQQAIEIWQTKLVGAKRHLVLMQFLRASVILETYGFDYYPVRDHQRQRAFLLGFNYAGIKTIRNGRIVNHFRWHNLSKISYERRMIIFHIYPNENSKRKQILGFKCLSNDECQNLYLRLLEQKYFFTVDLTYFDKSIRRPSLLNECSLNGATLQSNQADHQQHSQQQPTRSAMADYFQDEAQLDRADLIEQVELEEDNDDDEHFEWPTDATTSRRNTTARSGGSSSELVVDGLNGRRQNYCQKTTTTPRETSLENGAGGNQSSNCSTFDSSFEFTCNQQQQQRCTQTKESSRSQANLISSTYHQPVEGRRTGLNLAMKSSSLQESSQCDATASCQETTTGANYFSQAPSSTCCPQTEPFPATSRGHHQTPITSPTYLCCASLSADQHTMRPNHTTGHQLQRQSSFANFSPDLQLDPAAAAATTSTTLNKPHANRQYDWRDRSDEISQVQQIPDGNSVGEQSVKWPARSASASAGDRLLNWTDQLLVEPASLFCGNQFHTSPNARQAQLEQRPNNEMLMQGLRLCLIMLVLNFLLRLSDGLSSVLIDLLSFGGANGRETTPMAGKRVLDDG